MVDKLKNKAHVDHEPFKRNNGKGNKCLDEPVPAFHCRSGDFTITAAGRSEYGVNNNAIIVFGRDRSPYQVTRDGQEEMPAKNRNDERQVSGYSDHMAAGSLDLIVGRGAPYPMENWADGPRGLPPAYCWESTSKLTKGSKVLIDDSPHPGWVTDASRIYITQMADIDKYFRLAGPTDKLDVNPSSAIVLKSDKIRLHSRRDIKIIAGGDFNPGPKMDSNGFSITESGRIHLMSGNGRIGQSQQPMVLGDNLVECLREVHEVLHDMTEIFYTTLKSQMKLNIKIANHIHATGTGPTTTDPLSQIENLFKTFSDVGTIMDIYFMKVNNLSKIKRQFLERGTKHASTPKKTPSSFVLSPHHTVN
jgi:hypothetical protein